VIDAIAAEIAPALQLHTAQMAPPMVSTGVIPPEPQSEIDELAKDLESEDLQRIDTEMVNGVRGGTFIASWYSECARCPNDLEPGDQCGYVDDEPCCGSCWEKAVVAPL
jgi:hypothetical protein